MKRLIYTFFEKLRYDTAILFFLGFIEIMHYVVSPEPTDNICYIEKFALLDILNHSAFWIVFLFWIIRRIKE